MLLRVAASLAYPWFIKTIIDDVIPARDHAQLFMSLAVLVAIMTCSLAISFSTGYLLTKVNNRCVLDMRMALFRHLMLSPPDFHDKHETGDIVFRFNSDISAIQSFLSRSLDVVVDSLTLVGLIVIMWWLSLPLLALSVCVVPLFVLVTIHFQPKVKSVTEIGQAARSSLMEFIYEMRDSVKHV